MQNELDIVRDVSHRLEQAGFAYMLTGCDVSYIARWADELGVLSLWRETAP